VVHDRIWRLNSAPKLSSVTGNADHERFATKSKAVRLLTANKNGALAHAVPRFTLDQV